MSVLAVGSVGYDTVFTPDASATNVLGGSLTFFSIAASCFTQVAIVGVVGEDFREEDRVLLDNHGIDASGLKTVNGRTFRWSGRYSSEDANLRETLDLQLNVSDGFTPTLTREQRRADYLFLANSDPALQLHVLSQMDARPKLVAADTIDVWIQGKRDVLAEVLKRVDVVFMDQGEVRAFAQESNLLRAAGVILNMGPTAVIAKRGEYGALMLTGDAVFVAPAFPLERVVDPTGAGDTFAGGFMGCLAAAGDLSPGAFRRALVLGSVMGSFVVEEFSVGRLASITYSQLVERFNAFIDITRFDGLKPGETLPWRKGNDARREAHIRSN